MIHVKPVAVYSILGLMFLLGAGLLFFDYSRNNLVGYATAPVPLTSGAMSAVAGVSGGYAKGFVYNLNSYVYYAGPSKNAICDCPKNVCPSYSLCGGVSALKTIPSTQDLLSSNKVCFSVSYTAANLGGAPSVAISPCAAVVLQAAPVVVVVDTDKDTIADGVDNCPLVSNLNQKNQDADLFGDLCDNCIMVTNANQADADKDGIGDACEVASPVVAPAAVIPATEGVCNDNLDNDKDGLVDCNDVVDCYSHALAPSNVCSGLSTAILIRGDLPLGSANGDVIKADVAGVKYASGDVACQSIGKSCLSIEKFYVNSWVSTSIKCISSLSDTSALVYSDVTGEYRAKCGSAVVTKDTDGDGFSDSVDNCPLVANLDQKDSDGDKIGDACDVVAPVAAPPAADTDKDSVVDSVDNCPLVANLNQKNQDADLFGDLCDNCIMVTNANQVDTDKDGIGDACDVAAAVVAPAVVDSPVVAEQVPEVAPAAVVSEFDVNGNGCVDINDIDGQVRSLLQGNNMRALAQYLHRVSREWRQGCQ